MTDIFEVAAETAVKLEDLGSTTVSSEGSHFKPGAKLASPAMWT